MRPRNRWAEAIIQAEEIGDTIARRMRALPVVVTPEAPPAVPVVDRAPVPYEVDLVASTEEQRIELGIDARALNIRTDEDISVRLDIPRSLPIPLPAAESPFNLLLPAGEFTRRLYITAPNGAKVKIFAATRPFSVSFGRATPRRAPTAGDWHWQAGADVGASDDDVYFVAGPDGLPYTVPAGYRLVLERFHVSCGVGGEIQRFDMYDYNPATGTDYRFVATFFNIGAQRTVNYSLPAGHQLKIHLYNNNSVARHFRVTLHGYVEAL